MLDTVIIGAGIAGMTAAIYASRKRMDFVIIASRLGGQFMESGEVLNYPGIKKTTGAEFSSKMEKQLKFNKVEVKSETASKIEKAGDNFKVVTNKGEYETKTVIIATGAGPRKLGVPGEREYKNMGVTYCAICDGPLFKGKDVAVVGAGNAALESADFLMKIARKIYVLNIGKEFTAHEYLQERINASDMVEVITNAKTTEILGDGKMVSGLRYSQNGKTRELKIEGVFVEIGRVPNTDFVKGFLDLDEHGHIIIDCTTHTTAAGVFAAGDCASGHEYQYIIAAGQGCMALIKAARYLASKK
ncbi:FAD-dependent oxidoreductase [Candidatus Woesearchaeota archaeon]|nr:FAD-dependent oxidoreductase [Candidatus Woesearchaeota archaeon]